VPEFYFSNSKHKAGATQPPAIAMTQLKSPMTAERRRVPRRRCNHLAQIVTAAGERHNCMARDISRLGAQLLVSTLDGLPTDFILIIGHIKISARVVWWGSCKVGVSFP
jgi:hypothetical protein